VINFSAYTGSITDCNVINSLTFDAAVSSNVQVAKTLVLSSGGLMVTSNAGANGSSITGGTLLVPDSGGLVVHQHNADALGVLEISSRVIAAALSKSGDGELVLSGAGNVLGAVFVNEGVLRLAGGSALSDTAP
jgi:autotransporter-associated beta strand protein